MKMSSKGVSFSSRAFMTEFRATPPASARFFWPVAACRARVTWRPGLLGHVLDRVGDVLVVAR